MSANLNELFDNIHKLPQIPEVVRRIINQLNNPNADMFEIAKDVEKEQIISLKILRLVNSAHFGLSRKINSIEEATVMIGMAKLKTLVVASALISSISDVPNFDLKQFWTKTFLTASYAKWFAEKAGLDVEIAYTAGLFSGLGNLLLHIGAPKEANEIDQHVKAGSSRPEIERNKLGFTNQEACAELCRRWHLSQELTSAIEDSAEPMIDSQVDKLACCVYLADRVSTQKAMDEGADTIFSHFPTDISDYIAIKPAITLASIDEIISIHSDLEGLND
jgi:HD-like signal output (HDOD) protein